jgi:hypothetical protein
MFELLDTRPDVRVQESEYQRLLGYPDDHALEGRALELAQWARGWYAQNGRPWIYVHETPPFELRNGKLRIHGREFASKTLRDQLERAEATKGMLVVVSAGRECEERARQLWNEEKPDEYFFLEVLGSAVVEHLVTFTGARICAWAEPRGMAVLPHYSPGYTGWDVADQVPLFHLLRNGNGEDFPRDIAVKESGMLQPKKSLLALFGLTTRVDRVQALRDLVPCENCSFPGCQYRRAPFLRSLPQFEDVQRLQASLAAACGTVAVSASGLTRDAAYSVNRRALEKWSRERLQLNEMPDRSVQALFRYDGTTCSNMGAPLQFHYRFKLGPAEHGYPIHHAECAPAPGDTGHKKMCAWIEDGSQLRQTIENEKPLLGRPLNDVLAWRRTYSPAGCYCDADTRLHKWGLALEVIHYALVQREKQLELK